MPANVVTNPKQEKMWEHAKVLARRGKAKNKWALVQHIFQQEKAAGKVAHLDRSFSDPLYGEELVIYRGHVLKKSALDQLTKAYDPHVEMAQQYDQLLGMHGYTARTPKKDTVFREQEMKPGQSGLHIVRRIYDHQSGHTAILNFASDPQDPHYHGHHWNIFHPHEEGRGVRDPEKGTQVHELSSALDRIHGQLKQSFAKAGPRGLHVRPLGDALSQQRALETQQYSRDIRPHRPRMGALPAPKAKKAKLPPRPATLARSIVGFIRRSK